MVLTRKSAFCENAIQTPMFRAQRIKPSLRSLQNLQCKRSVIKKFSFASAARLRKTLALAYMPDSKEYALTLTLCTDLNPFCLRLIAPKIYRYFNIFVSRHKILKHCSFVWRCELQQNGLPHWHMLLYAPSHISGLSIFSSLDDIWWKLHHTFHLFRTVETAEKWGHALEMSVITDGAELRRYQSYHMSKHKKSQLGYCGRQWGIINRSNLKFAVLQEFFPMSHNADNVNIYQRFEIRIARYLRKYLRYRKPSSCVFGSRLSKPKWKKTRFVFVNSFFISKLKFFSISECQRISSLNSLF